ncbi:unnamed protein product [Owenia fusiformis]|uniref:Uncharacterized protein n=1 Tax=Owenia fusiformis TaxID=6347 RepID=A0A8J1Y9G5_OWEFU|nr:unnamed protein product [Owenia fusiformis]
MANKTSPEEVDTQHDKDHPTFKQLIIDFADNSTLHGLPRSLRNSVRVFRRLIWLGIFAGCFGYFIFQVIELIKDYNKWPILIKSEIRLRTFMDVPAVTICNVNMLRKSKIEGTTFDSLVDLDRKNFANGNTRSTTVHKKATPKPRNKRDGKVEETWERSRPPLNSNTDVKAGRVNIRQILRGYRPQVGIGSKENGVSHSVNTLRDVKPDDPGPYNENGLQGEGIGENNYETFDNRPIEAYNAVNDESPSRDDGLLRQHDTADDVANDKIRIKRTLDTKPSAPGATATDPTTMFDQTTTTISGQIPTKSDPVTTISDQTTTISGQIPTKSDPVTTISDQTTTISGQTPTKSDPVTTISDQTTTISGQTPTKSDPVTTISDQTTTISGQIPTKLDQTTTIFDQTATPGQIATNSDQTTTVTSVPICTCTIPVAATSAHTQTSPPGSTTVSNDTFVESDTTSSYTGNNGWSNNSSLGQGHDPNTYDRYGPRMDTGYTAPFTFKESPFLKIKNRNNFGQILNSSTAEDLSDIFGLATPTVQQLDMYGHRISDLAALCTFDMENCKRTSGHWLETYNKYYGKCYTWNSAINKPEGERPLVTTNFGSRYGLRLTLNVEPDEYTGLLSPTYGVRVSVHDNSVVSYPESDGLTVSVGNEMVFRLRKKKYERQPNPYPSNCMDGWMRPSKNRNRGEYTVLGCMMECLQQRLFEICGCFDRIVDEGEHRCNYFNRTEEFCRQKVYHAYNTGRLGCRCPAKCRESTYEVSTSVSAWPSKHHDHFIRERLNKINNISLHDIKNTTVRVHVYFEDFNEETVIEVPVYTVSGILSNIGGTMGMFIGLSLCTIGELLELMLDVAILLYKKLSTRFNIRRVGTAVT